jgi:hypothetical protein
VRTPGKHSRPQHEFDGRWIPGTERIQQVPGGKFLREIAEQLKIDSYGGPMGGLLTNKRNPIGDRRVSEAVKHGYVVPHWRR